MKPQSPEQLLKKRKVLFTGFSNRIKNHFSMGRIKTNGDFLAYIKDSDLVSQDIKDKIQSFNPNQPINFESLKAYLGLIEVDNPPISNPNPRHTDNLLPVDTTNQVYLPLLNKDSYTPIYEGPPPKELTKYETNIQTQVVKEESIPSQEDTEYILPPSPSELCNLYWFQRKYAATLLHKITVEHLKAVQLVATTGAGKTYIVGALVRRLVDMNFHHGKSLSPWPYMYVTKASVVEQTKRVLTSKFGLDTTSDIEVCNIEMLRSKGGKMFVQTKNVVINGEEEIIHEWRPHIHPLIIFWDESQILKNKDSTQSKIAKAFTQISPDVINVFISATPFSRIIEAEVFAIATRKVSTITWPDKAKEIAYPSDPEEYVEANMERLATYFKDNIVRVKGIKTQFKAINNVLKIDFESDESRKRYDDAYKKFLENKSKLEAEKDAGNSNAGIMILVQWNIFRQAAELERAHWIAKQMYENVNTGKKVSIAALNFKATIVKIVKILNEEFNVPRNKIALIWGGGKSAQTKKQKVKSKLLNNQLALDILKQSDITMEDLNLQYVETKIEEELPEHLKLGTQDFKERQREIDAFQRGDRDYCLFTFKAGGVGLSLHHTDELTTYKVKKKESGYAVESDIPNCPTKPRRVFVAPTFSAYELAQGLGRAPRLTSLSDTEQSLIFYRGTIEEHVADIASQKLRCLSKVIQMKESWEDVIFSDNIEEVKQKHINNTANIETESGDELADTNLSEDEEEE